MKAEKVLIFRLDFLRSRQMPDLGRSSVVDLANAGIEPPDATESGSERDLTHGQAGFVDKLFRKVQTARLCHRNRGCSQVSQEKATKVTRTNSQVFRKNLYSSVLEATLTDQSQSSCNGT